MIREYSYKIDGATFLSPHFQVQEFKSYDDNNQILTTDKILIDLKNIDYLEEIFNRLNCKYIIVTSGYRDDDFDLRLGGFLGYHSKGQAVDFMCYDENENLIDSKFVCKIAEDLGILGIGYGANYTHIDTRDYKSYFNEVNGDVNINSWYDYFGFEREKKESYFDYIVKENDCLTMIAQNFGKDWNRIYQDNRDLIGDNPDLIHPGQVLKIYE